MLIICLCLCVVAIAQPSDPPAPEVSQASDEPAAEEMIHLNLPGDVTLDVLISLVSDQLKIKILHDERVKGQRVSIKLPTKIPRGSLLGLLESALKLKGHALVPGDQPGWYRIDEARELTAIAPAISQTQGQREQADGAVQALTQVFTLDHATAKRVDQVIRPFLSKPGGNSIVVDEHDALIVTDYLPNVLRIEELVTLLDQPLKRVEIRFVKLEHLDSSVAAAQLRQLLTAQQKLAGRDDPSMVDVTDDRRSNRLVLIGQPEQIVEAQQLLSDMDIPLGLETRIYHFQIASPKQVDTLTKSLIGELKTRTLYQSAVDEKAGLLVVTATPEIHQQIQALDEQLDTQLEASEPTIQFYKLQNADVVEVLETIREIEGSFGEKLFTADGLVAQEATNREPPLPSLETRVPPSGFTQEDANHEAQPNGNGVVRITDLPSLGVQTADARIVADPNTNTLIVVAEPATQRRYEALIEKLDKRRPQVLVEVTFVTLDESDSFSLGVELSKTVDGSDYTMLNFTSFGLSDVDPDTGALTIKPGLGYNGAVISTDIANVIVRALATDGKGKVQSAPKILVNDNATGTLNSLADAPFTSVNASTTVATTSFGGYQSAGTTIEVTPRISEGEHLRLEYAISLSSFGQESGTSGGGGSGGDGAVIPPPRQRNEVRSEVTVPDGYTVVIGGLKRSDFTETVNKVPLLGDIPGVGALFSSTQKNTRDSTLFVFIRPVILRDDQFNDLKFLSDRQKHEAGMKDDFPESKPLVVR